MMCGIFCTNSKTIIATIIMVERNSGSAIQSQELGTTGLEMHISTMDSSLEFRLSVCFVRIGICASFLNGNDMNTKWPKKYILIFIVHKENMP